MTELDRIVVTVYSFIFSLPDEKQLDVLSEWWKYLERTCTSQNPCVECQRESEAQKEYEEKQRGKRKRKRVRWLKDLNGTADHAAQSTKG